MPRPTPTPKPKPEPKPKPIAESEADAEADAEIRNPKSEGATSLEPGSAVQLVKPPRGGGFGCVDVC